MPISQKKFTSLIKKCGFTKKEGTTSSFIFPIQADIDSDEECVTLDISLKKKGKLILIRTKDLLFARQSSQQAGFTTLAIICHHIPGLAFSLSPENNEVCLQSSIFVPDAPTNALTIRIHVNIILQTIEHYYEEISYAFEHDTLHHTFLPQSLQEKRIEDFQQMLEELQNFVNEEESTNDDDEPSDDIEWL